MFDVRNKLLSCVCLVLFAAIALPGHAGLHALLGLSHSHSHPNHSHQSAAKVTEHKHCSHRHQHTHQSQTPEQQRSEPSPIDEDDCPICEWFAQTWSADLPERVLAQVEQHFARPLALEVVVVAVTLGTPPARGPPTVC